MRRMKATSIHDIPNLLKSRSALFQDRHIGGGLSMDTSLESIQLLVIHHLRHAIVDRGFRDWWGEIVINVKHKCITHFTKKIIRIRPLTSSGEKATKKLNKM